MEMLPQSDIEHLLNPLAPAHKENQDPQPAHISRLKKLLQQTHSQSARPIASTTPFSLEDSDLEDEMPDEDADAPSRPFVPASQINLTGTEPQPQLPALLDAHASPDRPSDDEEVEEEPLEEESEGADGEFAEEANPSPPARKKSKPRAPSAASPRKSRKSVDLYGEAPDEEEDEEQAMAREEQEGGSEGEEGEGEGILPLDPLRGVPTAGPFDPRELEAQTQRILRDQAERDRIGKGYVAEAKPFTDSLALLMGARAKIAEKLKDLKKVVAPGPADKAEVLKCARERIAATAEALLGSDDCEMEIEEDEAEEGPAAPVVLVEPGPESESPDLTDSEDEFDPDGEDLAFDEDEELIQTDLAEEDEDEKRRRRREQKRRKAAGGAEGGEGAEGEEEEEEEDAPYEPPAGHEDPAGDASEDDGGSEGDASASESESEDDADGELSEGEEGEPEGTAAVPNSSANPELPDAPAAAAAPRDALALLMRSAAEQPQPEAAPMAGGAGGGGLVEDEAEMSEDEGHTDDEEDGDADGNLAELMGDHDEGRRDEKRRLELHKEWEVAAEKQAMRVVLEGVRSGWKNVLGARKRKAGAGEDDGTDLDARKRRAAQTAEARVGFGEGAGVLLSAQDVEASDDEGPGDRTVDRLKERILLDSLTAKDPFRPAQLDEASQGILNLIHRAKDRTREGGPGSHGVAVAGRARGGAALASGSGSYTTSKNLLLEMGSESQRSFLGRGPAAAAPTTRTGVGATTARGFIFGSASMRGHEDSQAHGDGSNLGGGGGGGGASGPTDPARPGASGARNGEASGSVGGGGLTLRAAFAGKLPGAGAPAVPPAGPGLVGLLKASSQTERVDFGRLMQRMAPAPAVGSGGKNAKNAPGSGFKRPFGR